MEQPTGLSFVNMNSGHQIHLSDGSVWRAARDAAQIVQFWQAGDRVAVEEKQGDAIWRFLITNEANGTSASALPSSNLR